MFSRNVEMNNNKGILHLSALYVMLQGVCRQHVDHVMQGQHIASVV